MDFFTKLVSDDKGAISSSRFLNLLVGVCACLMAWKMVIMGQMTDTAWGLLLAYGGGTYSFSKYAETRQPKATTDAK